MKLALTILFFISSVTSVTAESENFLLSKHGQWEVSYLHNSDGVDRCGMTTVNHYDEGFTLATNGIDTYAIGFGILMDNAKVARSLINSFEAGNWYKHTLTIGGTNWTGTVDSAIVQRDTYVFLIMDDISYDFRRALANGDYIDNGFDSGWSLHGSATALAALDKCRRRLSSNY